MKDNSFFNTIFESSPVPTVILEGQLPLISISEANTAYFELTGRTREEMIGAPFFISSPHPSMDMEKNGFADVERSIEEVFRTKAVVKTPVQKFFKPVFGSSEPEVLYLEATNTPVFTADGDIDSIIRTLQNVTDIVRASENEKSKDRLLLEKERFLSETQKVARIGSWEMDKSGRFYWSDIHYEIMDVQPGTEITVDFGLSLLKGERDLTIFDDIYKRAVESGDYFDVELNIITPKGNERWIRFTGKGELRDGEFVRMYGIGQDITLQKKTQEALLESRTQLEAIIQTVDGVVFEADAQTLELDFVSEQIEDLLGYTPEECIRQPGFISQILHLDDDPELLKLWSEQVRTQKNYTIDYRVVRKDGVVRWMKVSVAVIRENGAPKWLRGLMMDITSSKRLAELERVEKNVLELNAKSSETTERVLKGYLQGIESIFPEMRCSIMRVRNGKLHHWVAQSLPAVYESATDNLPIADNAGSCGTAAFKNEKVIVADIANDKRWENYKEIALQNNLRSCWSQPLNNASGEVVATLGMYYDTVKSPTEEELQVIDRTVYLLQVILQDRNNLELLEETNFLMEQSQELAHFGSVQYDLATREVTWSKELFNIFGVDPNVKPTVDLYLNSLHRDSRDRINGLIKNFKKTREGYIAEEHIVRPDGEVRHLKTWGRIKTNEKDEAVKVLAAYLDITDSKKVQEDLLASESRLRSLVDSQTNYVIRIDFNGNYTYANSKYIESFGPPTGKSILGGNSINTIVPQHQHRAEEIGQKCIAHPNRVFEVELEKYDNVRNIKYTFWHFVCLTDSKGEPKEIQCIGIDVSDKKKAEDEREKKSAELKLSEKRYSDLFHLSPQPMWVYDSQTLRFLDVNKAAVEQYGYSHDEFLAMTIDDIHPKNQMPELDEGIKGKLKRKNFFQGVFTHKIKSGELIRVDLNTNRIPFKDKRAHLVLAINITEPLGYLETLEKQNVRLAEIAWIQSHIVRAPLARILGLVDILKSDHSDPAHQGFVLDNIAYLAHELDGIIKEIVTKAEQATPAAER